MQEFRPTKFKMSLDQAAKKITLKEEDRTVTYQCEIAYSFIKQLLVCTFHAEHFHFNTITGRYIRLSGFGYVGSVPDDIVVTYGTCDRFD